MLYEGIPLEQFEYFNNKSVLFLVPHPDDEINIAGGLIHWLYQIDCKVSIVYTTNGNYRGKGKKRIYEAWNSVITLGGKREDVIFLGYSDQAIVGDAHLYTSKEAWSDRYGKNKTYVKEGEEFCFSKHKIHRVQNRENFINDIKEVIESVYPDIIFCVDFDSHPDHRATSLGFEYAMGEILKEQYYCPKVFKTFAYPLAYKGKQDFFEGDLKITQYNPEKFANSKFQNPYYKWEERVRFALLSEAQNLFLPRNIIYKALKCHKSQNISERADRIINSDQVAWFRRTDSLIYDAKITCSSGNANCLNDFVLFDCSDIMNGNIRKPIFDKGVWIPDVEDSLPIIVVKLPQKRLANKILLYSSPIENGTIRKMELFINNENGKIYINNMVDLIWEIKFEDVYINDIVIKILDTNYKEIGLSEIELYYEEKMNIRKIEFITQEKTYKRKDNQKYIFFINRILLFKEKTFHSIRRRWLKLIKKY